MPTVLREKGYRFHFYSNEGHEPTHVHVQRGDDNAKFWISPAVRLAFNDGFRRNELTEIRKIIVANRDKIKRKWNEYFSR